MEQLNIHDFIHLPVVNEAIIDETLTKRDSLVWITDVAARVYFESLYGPNGRYGMDYSESYSYNHTGGVGYWDDEEVKPEWPEYITTVLYLNDGTEVTFDKEVINSSDISPYKSQIVRADLGCSKATWMSFTGCSNLEEVHILRPIDFEPGVFSSTNKLTSVYVDSIETWLECSFNPNGPGGTNPISDKGTLFVNNQKLEHLIIPNSITKIKTGAFYNYNSLISIEIPDSVTSIGSYAFCNCSGLTSIEIPNSVTSIGSYAFCNCSGLTSIEIPNSVTSIGEDAFYGCSGLTSVTIPNSVTSIGYAAFYGCSGLTSISYNGTTSQWSDVTKGDNWVENTPVTVVHCSDDDVSI